MPTENSLPSTLNSKKSPHETQIPDFLKTETPEALSAEKLTENPSFSKLFNKQNSLDEADNDKNKKLNPDQKSKSQSQKLTSRRFPKKLGVGLLFFFLILTSLLVFLGFYTYRVAMDIKVQAQEAQLAGSNAYLSFKSQNLPGAEAELNKLKDKLYNIQKTYTKLGFYNNLPFVRSYYQDGQHGLKAAEAGINAGSKTLAAITPYADVLGFSGEESFEGGSAENRIKLILDTLEKVTPILDEIQADLEIMNHEVSAIDEKRYPENLRGIALREKITEGKALAEQSNFLLKNYRPIIEQIPMIAGSTGERKKYLVLFQNDNELRPTGGFLTAYSVIYIEDGKVIPEKSDDIYELDKKFNKKIPIPEALGRYLTTEKYWNLRDMNISPDFKESMNQFFQHYSEVRGEPDNIDGIIAVDTQLLTDLLGIVGPITIPDYGTFTADIDPRCDCPQIILALSEIITRPTPYLREDRKGILGPLMQAILAKIYSSPRTYMADMFSLTLNNIEGRHIQMYFLDETNQLAVEAINAAGRLKKDAVAQDFLAIINANLGGAKSNLFVDYKVTQTVSEPQDGKIKKIVEISYQNDHKADNCNLEAGLLCLNSTLRDWTRLYIPEGSQLIEAQGFTQEAKVYEENNLTVIDGFFTLEPMGQAKLKITYTVPYTAETYKIKLWKQGGIDPFSTIMDVTGGQEEILVNKDLIYETEF